MRWGQSRKGSKNWSILKRRGVVYWDREGDKRHHRDAGREK